MCHAATVERVARILGSGTAHRQKIYGKNSRAWVWIAQSRKGVAALKLIRPFLVTKAREADVALEFGRLPLALVGGSGGNKPVSRSLLARRERLYWKIRKLKPRWRFRKGDR